MVLQEVSMVLQEVSMVLPKQPPTEAAIFLPVI